MNFNSVRSEINSKNISVKELVNDFFSKIESKDQEINSYICITKDNAIAQAENPPLMAQAINNGVKAGRQAFLAGRIQKQDFAIASSPEKNISI